MNTRSEFNITTGRDGVVWLDNKSAEHEAGTRTIFMGVNDGRMMVNAYLITGDSFEENTAHIRDILEQATTAMAAYLAVERTS